MSSYNSKKTLLFKLLNLFVAFTFSFQNISFAVTQKDVKSPEIAEAEKLLSVDDIGIALDAGEIKSRYTADSGKVIIHIQDAHCNYEAQSNINNILEQVTKECGIDMISVEGAEGIVDTSWFRAFPDAEIRKEVATYFMKKGEIAGAEFFSINSDYEGVIFGAETRDYYVKNLKAFTEVYPYKDSIEKYFQNIRTVADRLKAMVYPPKLKEVDSKIRAFDAKEIELSGFSDYLCKTAAQYDVNIEDCVNLKKLLDTLEYERKIDFDIVDQERSQYIDVLSKKMSKENMTELVAQSIKFKKGHVKAVDFYTHLRNLAKEYEIPIVTDYPNLFYYYIYTKLYDGIDNESLFKEIDLTEHRLKEKLFTNADQEKLDRYSTMVNMFVDLINIELTNEDYDLFKAYLKESSLESAVNFVEGLSSRYNLNYSIGGVPGEISDNIPKMIDFYEIAMERDKVLIDNTIKEMNKEKKDKCILIAGGFHTRGIKTLLEKQGISYIVVTPKITKDVETPYIKVLTNQRTSLEDIITESTGLPVTDAGHKPMLNERPAPPAEKLLSPVLRIFTAQEFFTDPKEWKQIEKDLPADTIQRIEEIIEEVQEKGIEMWLQEKGLKEREAKLLDEYLKAIWTSLEQTVPQKPEKTKNAGEKAIKKIYNGLKPVVEKAFNEKVKTPGTYGDRAGVVPTEKARKIDEVYREYHKPDTSLIVKKNPRDDIRPGFVELIYRDLAEKLLSKGLPTDTRGGRGGEFIDENGVAHSHDVLRAHWDEDVYTALSQDQRDIVNRHELAHIDIVNVQQFYVEYCLKTQREAEKLPLVILSEGEGSYEAFIKSAKAKFGEDAVNTWVLWVNAKMPEEEAQETFVNSLVGCNVTKDITDIMDGIIAKKQALLKAQDMDILTNRERVIQENNMKLMEKYLMQDTQFGDTAKRELLRMQAEGVDNQVLEKFVKETFIKRYNIDLARTALTRRPYKGPKIIIISSSTEDEAKSKKIILDEIFKGLGVTIFSIVDAAQGGQIPAQIISLELARRQGLALDKPIDIRLILAKENMPIMIGHDGGAGKRCSPITQPVGNARGRQSFVGDYLNSESELTDADLLFVVLLNCLDFAQTNKGDQVDTFWMSSQTIAGTIPHTSIRRPDSPFAKFLVPIDWTINQEILLRQLRDFGTATADKNGNIQDFYGNGEKGAVMKKEDGSLALNPEHAYIFEDLKNSPNPGFDFGSFTMNNAMTLALWDYWMNKKDEKGTLIIDHYLKTGEFDGKKWHRDLDPKFTQPGVFLLRAIVAGPEILEDIPQADTLRNFSPEERVGYLQSVINTIRQRLPEKIRVKMGEIKLDDRGKIKSTEILPHITETIEFFLLNRDNEKIFKDLTKVVGSISLGANSEWQTYRNALDITNEKLFMLAALSGKVIELQKTGDPIERDAVVREMIRAENALRRRNISFSNVCDFYVNGKHIVLSSNEVFGPEPWKGEGIIIHRSIIQGERELLPGSEIIDSVVDKSEGLIVAQNAYVQKNTVTDLTVENGMAHMIVWDKPFHIKDKIVTDIFRPQINDTRDDFIPGQTRAIVGLYYDPEIGDKVRVNGNLYALGEKDEATGEIGIRGMKCVRSEYEAIEEKARERVRKIIAKRKMELRVKRALIEAQAVFEKEADKRNLDKKMVDSALIRLHQWLVEEEFEQYRGPLFTLIDKAQTQDSVRKKLFESFARETPVYFSIDYESMENGIGPNRRNGFTLYETRTERQIIERSISDWEVNGLPVEVEARLESVHQWLNDDAKREISINKYAEKWETTSVQAAAELRYLSSVKRELFNEEGRPDKFAGIEMIDNTNGENLGPVFRKFDIEAHGQKVAFRTYDLRAATKSNYWFMPGLVEPKFFGAMMSEKLAFKSGQGAATYAIKDAEKNTFGKGNVPKDKLWAIVSSGCRLYSERLRKAYILGLQAAGMKVLEITDDKESVGRVKEWLEADVQQGRRTYQEMETFLNFAKDNFEQRGIISTPQYYFLTRLLRYRWISVGVDRSKMALDKVRRHFIWFSHGTGSHNPAEYNGFKQVIVRWIETKLQGVVNYVLSINDKQMTEIRDYILKGTFYHVSIEEMQKEAEKMSATEVAYMHNEYVKARARLGEDVWGFIMDRELADAKPYGEELSEKQEEARLRRYGIEGFLMNKLRRINWNAEWPDIRDELELPERIEKNGKVTMDFSMRPPLCYQEPFKILTDIAQRTGRQYALGIDFMHGSAGLSKFAYVDLGLKEKLFTKREIPDGSFKGKEPYPNLFEFTKFFIQDLIKYRMPGIAKDEDSDRNILYLKDGRMIQGDIMEAVIAENRIKKEAEKAEGERKKLIFIGEVKFSSVLDTHIKNVQNELEKKGKKVDVQCILTPVGFGYIKDAMEQINSAILAGKESIVLFAGRPSPVKIGENTAPIVLDLKNAQSVILGAELSGHQMDKFWFAEDELTIINMLSAWIEAIEERMATEPELLEKNPENLWNLLEELINRVPQVSTSPELRLGSEDNFTENQVQAIRERAGENAVLVATKDQQLSSEIIAKEAPICKEIIVQGMREAFIEYMRKRYEFNEVKNEVRKIAGDNCFVYRASVPVNIELGGSFQPLRNVEFYINRIDGMLVYFKAENDKGEDEWGSFVIRKSNTQPEIISRVEGATQGMRDTIGVFMLSFFEKYQGTYLARDVYVSQELFPQLAYYKLSEKLKEKADNLVPIVLERIKEAIRERKLSKNLSGENLAKFVFFKNEEERDEELERLIELAKILEEKHTITEDTDLRELIDSFLGDDVSKEIAANVQSEYKSKIKKEVESYGSSRLYEKMPLLIAEYINISARNQLLTMLKDMPTQEQVEIPTPGIYAATPQAQAGNLGQLLSSVIPTAQSLMSGAITPESAVKNVSDHFKGIRVNKGDIILFTQVVMQSENVKKVYGVASSKELVVALRLMQVAALIGNLEPTNPYFTRYAWAGEGNRVQYNLSAPGQNEFDVSEVWNGITIKSKRNPEADSVIPDTAIIGKDGKVIVPDITLRELVNIAPELFLGKGHKAMPFFIKSLSTRFADKVYEGFNEKILEVGEEEYTSWLIEERENVEYLLRSLRSNLTKIEFEEYRVLYEQWTDIQADNGWKLDSIDKRVTWLVIKIQPYLAEGHNSFGLLDGIAKRRAEIVSVLNEIELEDGMIVLSPTGTTHGIFGLSLQVHPTKIQKNEKEEMEYPKSEAWIVKSVFDENGKEQKILIEPQQTSDTTFSVADFFTPITWDAKQGKPEMRKDVTEEQLRYFVGTSMEFKVTPLNKIILEPKDVTPSEGVKNAVRKSLINEISSIWPTKYFIAEEAILEGKGPENKASIVMPKIQGHHMHDLMVLEGTVTIKRERGKETVLTTGMFLPMDAREGEYTIESEGKAEVLRVYPEEESYVEAETQSEDVITKENFVQYTPEEEQEIEEQMIVPSSLETESSHVTKGIVTDEAGMSQEIELKGETSAPGIIGERHHVLYAEMGDFALRSSDKDLMVVKEGASVIVSKDKIIDSYGGLFPISKGEYTMIKNSLGLVKVKVSYENTEEEKNVCTAWKGLTEFRGEIAQNKYTFIAPKAMYVDGGGIGSKDWEKGILNKFLRSENCFNISDYNAETGLFSVDNVGNLSGDVITAIKNAVRAGRIPLLVATQKLFDDASKNEKFLDFLKINSVRVVPPIPDLAALEDKGWSFTREVEAKAMLQGLLNVKSIREKDALARKIRMVISQSLRRNFEFDELYYLLAFGDTEALSAIGKSTFDWMLYMIQTMLQRMPVEPFNAYEDLENQRRTMYSV